MMNPIELGRRAEAANDNYLGLLFNRLYEQILSDFMTCKDPEGELKILWDRKEAIDFIQSQVTTDIQRGKIAEKELNK